MTKVLAMSDVSFSGPSPEKAVMVISCRKQIGLDQSTVEVVRYMMLLRYPAIPDSSPH